MVAGMTPHEFQQHHGIDSKRLRRYLRDRWPNHHYHDPWDLNPTMVDDACAHFGIAPSRSVAQHAPGRARATISTSCGAPPRSSGLHVRLRDLASAAGIPLEFGRPVPWLSGQGHTNPIVTAGAAPDLVMALAAIHGALGGTHAVLAAKRAGNPPTPDLVHTPTGCLIEVDEVQHFTSARLQTLASYPPVRLGFDVAEYRSLITRFRPKGDKAFAHRVAPDFPQPGGRQAQRAYNDALRDLLAPTFTDHPLIRIPVPDRVVDHSALERLLAALSQLT